MRQVVQTYDGGGAHVADVPAPMCRPGTLVVRTSYSLVSAGTERMKVEQARMGLIAKARARPDQVRQVLESVRQTGVAATYQKVRERLGALTPLGYSMAGVVEEVGAGIDDFAPGDRVACAGEGVACHAEFVAAPRNLCVRVPDGVDLKDAAFSTVGAIAIQGVRQAGVTLGDSVMVIGLGLVGLLAVQALKAAGCRVIGVDPDEARVELARLCGADAAARRDDAGLDDLVRQFTGGAGVDAAYVAASAASADPMDLAGRVTRDRGRVVIVGMVKVEADWRTYYRKELSVVMSRSYGPGRYDRSYEQKGQNYPIGYVRWTLRRNLEEFVRLVESGQVRPSILRPAIFRQADAAEAYRQLEESPGRHAVGMLFEYPRDADLRRNVAVTPPPSNGRPAPATVGIGLIGAGNFATGTLIPALKGIDRARLTGVCSTGGLSAAGAARRHGFEFCTSDYRELLADPRVDAVVIATRHDTHAALTAEALRAGKHVYVEKPLALDREQLDAVIDAQAATGGIVMTGFNRRHSPLAAAVREFFAGRTSPMEVVCRVHAGEMAADSWYQDADEGGWRIVSEGCHFVDLIRFITGSRAARVFAERIDGTIPGGQRDNCVATLRMDDGSIGTLVYVSNGDACCEKERIEAFGQGRTGVIENWRAARLMSGGRRRTVRPGGTGKGHGCSLAAWVQAIRMGGADAAAAFDSAVEVTRTTFAIEESLRRGEPVEVFSDDAGVAACAAALT